MSEPCTHGYTRRTCDTCLALSPTDLIDDVPEAKLVLVPLSVIENMQDIIDAPMMSTDSDEAAQRFADLSAILGAVTP